MERMSAKPVSEKIRSEISDRVSRFSKTAGRKPKLCVVLVGEDPASQIYTSKKGKAAVDVGMDHETITFSGDAKPEVVRAKIDELNSDSKVDGILVQRPLPKSFKEEEIVYWISPEKDVDAFHPENVGRLSLGLECFQPCTPAGVMRMIEHYGIEVKGKDACVVGRSSIVGKPMAALLTKAHASVDLCHSKTKDLVAHASRADLLIAAAGVRELIGKEHVKPGAVVIDVGIHRKEDGKLCGDVKYDEVAQVASALTPVPGGVGPMTITMLLENTIWSAERSVK